MKMSLTLCALAAEVSPEARLQPLFSELVSV